MAGAPPTARIEPSLDEVQLENGSASIRLDGFTSDDGAGAAGERLMLVLSRVPGCIFLIVAGAAGKLEPKHASFVGGGLEVEVLMWRNVWQRVRRPLPEALAQVRVKRGSTAAMVFSRPEKAWIEPSTPQELLDVSMVTLGALRMLPLGFEG